MDTQLIAFGVPAYLVLIAIEAFVSTRRAEPLYSPADTGANMASGITYQVLSPFVAALTVGGFAWRYEHARLFTIVPSTWWHWLALIVVVDFGQYWYHRASHRVRFLWAIHAVHHHSQEFNLGVNFRQAWLSGLAMAAFFTPFVWIGIEPGALLLAYTIGAFYQFPVHTRLVGKLWKPIEWVFNTPSHHRVHHAMNVSYLDKNHSAIFILWDRMFGTYAEEVEAPVWGTIKPLPSANPWVANIDGWQDIVANMRGAGTWLDALKTPFMPPEWRPRALGGVMTLPNITRETQQRFMPEPPRAVQRVTTFLFVTAAVLMVMFMLDGRVDTTLQWLLAGVTLALAIAASHRITSWRTGDVALGRHDGRVASTA